MYAKTVSSSVCGTSRCSHTPTNTLSAGDYEWRVGAYVGGVWRSFSYKLPFSINLSPSLNSPSGTIYDTTPNYRFYPISEATKYELQLYKGSTQVYTKTISTSSCPYYECYYTSPSVLNPASYQWRVRAYVNSTWQSFSAFQAFTITSSGGEYFNTQFNILGDLEGWSAGPSSYWFVQGGSLSTTTLSNGYTSSVNYTRLTDLADFTYQVRMKMNGTDNIQGLIVRGVPTYDYYNDWENGYYFYMEQVEYENNKYACFSAVQIEDGDWNYSDSYCYDPSFFELNKWNDFRVVAVGNNLRFYVNDYPIFNVSGSGSTNGRVGIVTLSWGTSSSTLYVDWAKAGTPGLISPVNEKLLKPALTLPASTSKFYQMHNKQ